MRQEAAQSNALTAAAMAKASDETRRTVGAELAQMRQLNQLAFQQQQQQSAAGQAELMKLAALVSAQSTQVSGGRPMRRPYAPDVTRTAGMDRPGTSVPMAARSDLAPSVQPQRAGTTQPRARAWEGAQTPRPMSVGAFDDLESDASRPASAAIVRPVSTDDESDGDSGAGGGQPRPRRHVGFEPPVVTLSGGVGLVEHLGREVTAVPRIQPMRNAQLGDDAQAYLNTLQRAGTLTIGKRAGKSVPLVSGGQLKQYRARLTELANPITFTGEGSHPLQTADDVKRNLADDLESYGVGADGAEKYWMSMDRVRALEAENPHITRGQSDAKFRRDNAPTADEARAVRNTQARERTAKKRTELPSGPLLDTDD